MKTRSKKKGQYRSQFEHEISKQLPSNSCYEGLKITYNQPMRTCTYTPDFILPNNIIIEVKGLFDVADRKKHLLVREQYPYLDIRFLFQNAKLRLNKRSRTTYADWCHKYSFIYAEGKVPKSWITCQNQPLSDIQIV